MAETQEKKQARYTATRNVTLIGVAVNALLSIAQLLGGFFAQSQALIADGVHTLSDLASDFVVLFAAKAASKDADEDHPYGHGRFETVATVILGIALGSVAIGIAMNAINRLMQPETLLQPKPLALLFVALAIISKEGLYHYTMSVAKRVDSKLLKANAWHHRSDAISSILVAIGVAGSVFLKIPWLDAAAAIIVAMMIFYMGLKLIMDSTMELVDTAWEPEKTDEIKSFIGEIEGVEEMHMLRTRKMGDSVLGDIHVQVNPYLSVSEGHHIADSVITKLRRNFPEMNDITVHIDPEDDEVSSLSKTLPNRHELMVKVYPVLQTLNIDQAVHNINLHYIKGKIELEIIVNAQLPGETIQALKETCESFDEIRSLTMLYRMD
ncbi:cation diffusion facilitator family transporter [Cocleimonas flava]|uniref:Cation diffusion facilitator family transporter n=1 Tax=Cocleimonas flava TaxID=634765 RepID=A0A4R1F4N8_9GAMM|nr:cation diffusion facilitator family transporter [Cocleimonas flava]TCJ89207.1 cation diffusion facilitator family transporter [Cocleimonas flava]